MDGIVRYGGDATHPPKFKMVNPWHLPKTSRLRAHQKGVWLAAVYGATSLYNSTVLPSRRQLDPDLPWSLHSPRRCSPTWQTNPLPRITSISHRPKCLMESAFSCCATCPRASNVSRSMLPRSMRPHPRAHAQNQSMFPWKLSRSP